MTDHCGNNTLFSNAVIYIQTDELACARSTRYTVNHWFDYNGARIHPVSGELEIAAGITLLPTPGHTPGHQSVLVQTHREHYLIAAQVAFTSDEFRRGGDPATHAHEGLGDQYVESIRSLKAHSGATAWFSHDENSLTL